MKHFSILILICCSVFPCTAQSQSDVNTTADKEYQHADKELHLVYNRILREYNADTTFLKNLQKAQRIWVSFLDAELQAKYPERELGYYGSIYPACWLSYKTELTQARTNALRVWLEGIPEGAICSGSVKTQ